MKLVTTRDSSRVGLKPATARTRCSRVKPIARPERNPLRIPSHPQSPNNGALFVFAIRPSQQIATPAPAESPAPTDVTSNRLTAPAHTETRPAPQKRHGSLQPQTSPVCFNDAHSGGCSPHAVPWSVHGCPLQPQISRRRLGERWANSGGWAAGGGGGTLSTHCPRCSYAPPNSAITSHSQKQND